MQQITAQTQVFSPQQQQQFAPQGGQPGFPPGAGMPPEEPAKGRPKGLIIGGIVAGVLVVALIAIFTLGGGSEPAAPAAAPPAPPPPPAAPEGSAQRTVDDITAVMNEKRFDDLQQFACDGVDMSRSIQSMKIMLGTAQYTVSATDVQEQGDKATYTMTVDSGGQSKAGPGLPLEKEDDTWCVSPPKAGN